MKQLSLLRKRKVAVVTLFALVTVVLLYAITSCERSPEQTSDRGHSLDAWAEIDQIQPAEDIVRFKQSLASISDGRYEDAVPVVLELAKDGIVEAQVTMGRLYADGHGVRKSVKESAKWYRSAAAYYERKAGLGDVEAQYQFGLLYFEGIGVERKDALVWTLKAARRGHPKAQFLLAKLYSSLGSSPSAEHVKWLKESARNGYAPAQYRLGVYYTRGTGVEKDEEKSKFWLERAAAQGYRE
jgi:hypothetical protein